MLMYCRSTYWESLSCIGLTPRYSPPLWWWIFFLVLLVLALPMIARIVFWHHEGLYSFETSLKWSHSDKSSLSTFPLNRTLKQMCACVPWPSSRVIIICLFILIHGMNQAQHNCTSCTIQALLWSPSHSLTKLPYVPKLSSPIIYSNKDSPILVPWEMKHDIVRIEIVL